MKILIVDDTETNPLVLDAMVRKDGQVVFEGVNEQEGLTLFEQKREMGHRHEGDNENHSD